MRIIIPTMPEQPCRNACLETYKLLTPEIPITLVVGGTLSGKEATAVEDRGVRDIIELGENKGFTGNINAGLEACQDEDIVILSNDDVLALTPTWPKAVEYTLSWEGSKKPKGVAAVGPISNYVMGRQRINVQGPHLESIPALSFFWIAIRREALDDVGFLDPAFGVGLYDDVDWCVRATKAGWDLIINRGITFWHWGSQTIQKVCNYQQQDAVNRAIFENKHPPEPMPEAPEEKPEEFTLGDIAEEEKSLL